MTGHLFISYSRVDGDEFALRLADELEAGPPAYDAWVDVRELQPEQEDWDRQLLESIKTCGAVVFVMTGDSVLDESGCKPEWVAALKYKKPIVPVRVHSDAELPFRLSSREFIDFSEDFDRGLARLRRSLARRDTPEGVLRGLRHRLADAEYELPRASDAQRPRVKEEIAELRRRLEEQQQVVQSPQEVVERTEARIGAAMEREREPERPVLAPARAKFVNPPPMTAPTYFQDRHVETEMIVTGLREDGIRMVWVVGRGGVGKTAMVCRLLKALEQGRLPDDLGELEVNGIVYLSPLGHPVNFPNLFDDLCRLLSQGDADALRARYRDPQETPAALMRTLLEAFPAGRSVVLLDNFEELVDAEAAGLTDAALDEALGALLKAPAHGVKVIITTRIAPRGFVLTQPGVQRRVDLDEGLPSPYAEQVLKERDPDGRLGIRDAPEDLLTEARERTRGFPRALEALAAILAADRGTTLPELLDDTRGMPENVVEALVGEAFSRLDASSQRVMQALAIYVTPVPAVAVDYLLQPFEPAIDSAPLLSRLVNMSFVRRDAGKYYLHQVDQDYALQRVPAGEPTDCDADSLLFTQYSLRHRGADYFEQTRTPRETWRDLNDLAPQLAEFDLRSQAGEFDAAAQVLLDIDEEYLILWGHYRLVSDLHQRVEGRVSDPWTRAASLGNLALCFDTLGDPRRAIELAGEAIAINREIGDRAGEAAFLGRLGNCYFSLGEIGRAIEVHEEALKINEETGSRGNEAAELGSLASCYYTLGEIRHAIDLYERAIVIDREVGVRKSESTDLGNLANCYYMLGETRRAIDVYNQALAINRDIGSRQGESYNLGNLGMSFAAAGETRRGIELQEQALEIDREIGDRGGESTDLMGLGDCYADLGLWEKAAQYCEQAIEIADEIDFAQGQNEGRLSLATVQLHAGDHDAALETLQAIPRDYPPTAADLALVAGIALVRQGKRDDAGRAFAESVRLADALLEHTGDNYHALDIKALALSGRLADDVDQRPDEVRTTFRAARAVTRDKGTVERVLRLFDALASAFPSGTLEPIRPAAAGD